MPVGDKPHEHPMEFIGMNSISVILTGLVEYGPGFYCARKKRNVKPVCG